MNQDAEEAVLAIEQMYAALAVDDRVGVSGFLTPAFYAFENGVRMSGVELLDLLGNEYAKGVRLQWSVTAPEVHVCGDFCAVVYLNVGSVTEVPGADPIPLSWLETVLLRREATGWRVAFLHSTRTKESQKKPAA